MKCAKWKTNGTPCPRPVKAIAVVAWSGERVPVCGVHWRSMAKKLGSGVSFEDPKKEATP